MGRLERRVGEGWGEYALLQVWVGGGIEALADVRGKEAGEERWIIFFCPHFKHLIDHFHHFKAEIPGLGAQALSIQLYVVYIYSHIYMYVCQNIYVSFAFMSIFFIVLAYNIWTRMKNSSCKKVVEINNIL